MKFEGVFKQIFGNMYLLVRIKKSLKDRESIIKIKNKKL
jgi:hypothetical protein